jgi:hypothetical protein
MKRNLFLSLFASILVLAGVSFAQQGPSRAVPAPGPLSVVTGSVVSFTAAAGQGTSLVIDREGTSLALGVGPLWFLQKSGFAAAAGNLVEATVFACPQCSSGHAVVSVKNLTNGTSVTLRNDAGSPLWIAGPGGSTPAGGGPSNGSGYGSPMGRANGPGNGPGAGPGSGPASGPRHGFGNRAGYGDCDGTGPDMAQLQTFAGKVKSFEAVPGAGRPLLVLETAEGERTFVVAPYRAIRDAGFELVAGAELSLTAAPSVNQEWVVVTIKDVATGVEIQLRDANGLPLVGCAGRC